MQTYKLSEVSEIYNGGTPSTSNNEYWDGDIPWITPKDLSGYNKREICKGERTITRLGLENSNAKLIPPGSILVSTRAPIGYIVMNRVEATTNQGMKSVIPNKNLVEPNYLYYLLKTKVTMMNMKASGTTFKEISTTAFKSLTIDLPDLVEQKKVSNQLVIMDDKIHVNTELIQNLEEYSQLLFHKWFVDFNFPNEEGKPYKDSGGEMVEVDGKMIPKGWNHGPIQNLVSKTITGEWGNDNNDEKLSEVLCIRGADLPNWKKGAVNTTPIRYVDVVKSSEKQLKHGDIMIEISGGSPTQSTGRTIMIRNSALENINKPVYCSNFCKIIRPIGEEYGLFLGLYFEKLYNNGVFFHHESKTTGLKNLLLPRVLKGLKIYLPEEKLIEQFNQQVSPISDKINQLGHENHLLEEMRDLLIKKLIK